MKSNSARGFLGRGARLSDVVVALIAGVTPLITQTASASGILLVGNRFALTPSNVLAVDPATGTINGVFGQATNFDPAPGSMAMDHLGRIYILDSNRNQIQRFDASGNFIDIFANSGFSADGLYYGLAIDAADNVYVGSDGSAPLDPIDDAVVSFDPQGHPRGTFGQADAAHSDFHSGAPLIFDKAGNLYATSFSDNVLTISRFAPDGAFLGTFGQASHLTSPLFDANALAFDKVGNLYVRQEGAVLEYDATGNFLRTFADRAADGGIAFDGQGNLFAAERLSNRIEEFDADGNLVATITDASSSGPGNLLFVPEPAGLLLVALCIPLAARRRSRTRLKARPIA